MRIVAKGIKARETTLSEAVSIVTDCDGDSSLRDMVTRLLEELTFTAAPVLSATQLSRILAYKFDVREE